ncbi:MAG: hypothetical protein AAGF77_07065 [Bacteroidota bacterium]
MKKLYWVLLLLVFSGNAQQEILVDKKLGEKLTPENGPVEFYRPKGEVELYFVGEQQIVMCNIPNNFTNAKVTQIEKISFDYINYLGTYGTEQKRFFVYGKNSKKKFLLL